MKTRLLQLSFALLLGSLPAARAADVKLTGIVWHEGRKSALLEMGLIRPILQEGERVEKITVTRIDEKAAKVTIEQGDKVSELSLEGGGATKRTFNFAAARSSQVLEVYQELQGVTVLRSPGLVGAHVTLQSEAGLSRAAAAAALEEALKKQGTVVVPRFDKYAFAVPISHVPRLAQLPPPPPPSPPGDKDRFPSGLLKFDEAAQAQVLEIYQELTGQTVLRAPDLPSAKVTVRSQTVVSRAEAIWILETALRLGGIAMFRQDKLAFALPNTRNVAAPAVTSNASLAPAAAAFPPGPLKFAEAPAATVLEAYAKLLGRKAVLTSVPACRFTLKSQTPLTRGEAIHALDAAAALNHVRFLVTDQEVQLIPAARVLKDAAP